jgi:hypothetical protein
MVLERTESVLRALSGERGVLVKALEAQPDEAAVAVLEVLRAQPGPARVALMNELLHEVSARGGEQQVLVIAGRAALTAGTLGAVLEVVAVLSPAGGAGSLGAGVVAFAVGVLAWAIAGAAGRLASQRAERRLSGWKAVRRRLISLGAFDPTPQAPPSGSHVDCSSRDGYSGS